MTRKGEALIDVATARGILEANDRDGHTVPTDGLYPFQWSWDSAITALGWQTFDEPRAWREAEVMFDGQWDNGMVPHILFHGGEAESYFPGPDVWGSQGRVPSSAVSQPAIWATTLSMMLNNSRDRDLAEARLAPLIPKLVAYHRWWYRERDPDDTGLIVSYHPWESGMDNSPAWDEPLSRVPEVDWSYERRDLGHVDSDQRPHKPEYDRYLYLVDFFKRKDFDSRVIYDECPYRVVDICLVALLHRASLDVIALCKHFGVDEGVADIEAAVGRTEGAINNLWSEERRCFLSYDTLTDEPLDVITTGTALPLFANLATEAQAAAMLELIGEWLDASTVGLASTHPESPLYEPKRYWRGPLWLHINWMIALGAAAYGRKDIAERLREDSRRCANEAGFWEYFDPDEVAGCGGDRFSWTAAVALYWLA